MLHISQLTKASPHIMNHGVTRMPYEKAYVRKDAETEELYVFVPSKETPKGYIRRWNGDTAFEDVRLSVYDSTKAATAEETRAILEVYCTKTGKPMPKVGERLRGYQQGLGDYSDSYHLVPIEGGGYLIEDSKGVLIKGYSSKEAAVRDFARLIQGKSI